MKKILRLQSALLKEIDKYEKLIPERDHFIDWERVHITSCAKMRTFCLKTLPQSLPKQGE